MNDAIKKKRVTRRQLLRKEKIYQMKTVSGYVENITFRNEDNGFAVLTLSSGKKM